MELLPPARIPTSTIVCMADMKSLKPYKGWMLRGHPPLLQPGKVVNGESKVGSFMLNLLTLNKHRVLNNILSL